MLEIVLGNTIGKWAQYFFLRSLLPPITMLLLFLPNNRGGILFSPFFQVGTKSQLYKKAE